MTCASRVWEDPGWNPGLNEAEALAGPGRFFMVLIMARMIGYILTWTTYGKWLQRDKRGYVKEGEEPED